MSEELNLVKDLAVILMAAGIFTIISRALKQPLILGYIIAGFLVGPHLGLVPISSTESVDQWSEIGIIFLLFALGLEFSFKKLLKVGSSALIMAGTICIGMFVVGMATGNALGWSSMESIFLGGMLSMSSTTIIIKAYDDMGLKQKPYAGIIFGSLVVEDLIAILMMVLLSTLAVSNKFSGGEMLFGLAKLLFFLILWFIVGIYAIPSLLKWAHRYLNDEILLIISIGLCFLMVTLASAAGFSSALGAFVMGSILAETVEGERIEKSIVRIKDLFGAIFFVSVGMMVDPAVIARYWPVILIITLVVVSGILIFSTLGAIFAGQGLDNSVHAGFTMAQLGEFAFIIAGVGCSLGVLRDFIYPVIITVSVITAFTTPFMIKASDPVAAWLGRVLPKKLLLMTVRQENSSEQTTVAEHSAWKSLLTSYFLRIVLYSVILAAILLGSKLYLDGAISRWFPDWSPLLHNLVITAGTVIIMLPFLYGLTANSRSVKEPAQKLIRKKESNKWPVTFLVVIRSFIAVGFVLSVIFAHFDNLSYRVILLIALAALIFLRMARRSMHRFSHLEERFLANLNQKEAAEMARRPVTGAVMQKLSGEDIHLEPVTVSSDSQYAGRKLSDIPFRSDFGINIVKITRGKQTILIPGGDDYVYPGDELLAVGTKSETTAFREAVNIERTDRSNVKVSDFAVDAVRVGRNSYFYGKSLAETGMRAYGCMLIGVRRNDASIMSPKPDFKFREGDVLWIAGDRSSIDWFASTDGEEAED